MSSSAKPIRLSRHAQEHMLRRGFTVADVELAIRTASWQPARDAGRYECRKDLPYNTSWNGKWYATKQVRPIFVEAPDEIVIVTVYTYYF